MSQRFLHRLFSISCSQLSQQPIKSALHRMLARPNSRMFFADRMTNAAVASAPSLDFPANYSSNAKKDQQKMLEQQCLRVILRLFETRDAAVVSTRELEKILRPFLAENIVFKDAIQHGEGVDPYWKQRCAWHRIATLYFAPNAASVNWDLDGNSGRAILDGHVMYKLGKEFYPFRCVLIFNFRVAGATEATGGQPHIVITQHEEIVDLKSIWQQIPYIKIVDLFVRRVLFYGITLLVDSIARRSKLD